MAAVRILLGIVWLAAVSSGWGAGSDGVATSLPVGHLSPRGGERSRVLNIARAEVGVREATGRNDGKRIEAYLAAVGLPKGHPYCAAFVSWVFKKAGYEQPRTAWSPALFPAKRLIEKAAPGNVFGIYFPALKRIAHCGFVLQVKDDWIGTVEANTSLPGSREGDGVYVRIRHFRTIKCYADWIGKGGAQ